MNLNLDIKVSVYYGKACGSNLLPEVSIIIPTLYKQERGLLLNRLINDLYNQTLQNFEVIIIEGDDRQGRAINKGVSIARGEYIVTMDDDTILGNENVLKNLISSLKNNKDYGIVGAATEIPDWANYLQKKAMKQIPRRYFPTQDKDIESDMVQHPCLAMRKDLFLEIGGEDEELKRGLDPILRYKVRQKKLKIVVVKDTWIYHLLPNTLSKLLKMYFRNGRGSCYAQFYYPTKVYLCGDGFEGSDFNYKEPLKKRILKSFMRFCDSIVNLQLIYFLTQIAYFTGYIYELIVLVFNSLKERHFT